MANPNIVNVTTINGGNAGFNLTATTTATLMTVSGSGVIVKVNRITVANVDGSAAADVDLFVDGFRKWRSRRYINWSRRNSLFSKNNFSPSGRIFSFIRYANLFNGR